MLVFKFGGASVKDADAIKNLHKIVKSFPEKLVIVISALGKTTNALEEILKISYHNEDNGTEHLRKLKQHHLNIAAELISDKSNKLFEKLENEFERLNHILFNKEFDLNPDLKYDQVVSFGEIFSTLIVSEYLNLNAIKNSWIDIRDVFVTDDTYREAKIHFELTRKVVQQKFSFENTEVYLTQGFIGRSKNGFVTTLGREGSDYTAAVLANLLDAEKLVVWKDVEGVLNADPQYFGNTQKLDELSYQEAVELAYFGAKVIHPKTLKPLHNKNINLYVKSFLNPEKEGTVIKCIKQYNQDLPIYIVKKNQVLISIFPKDLSFVIEDELSTIFRYLSEQRIKVNLIQNSAISISFCVDNTNHKVTQLIEKLNEDYKVLYNDQLELLTIRHYTEEAIHEVTKGRKVYIEQRSRTTAHFVIR
ncbi:MAG TPA: aspartate kinase [Bacteroidales bacterium]|nr:aspartate kinase [Bacteroidales bacterium]